MSAYDLNGLYIKIEDCPKGTRICDFFPELEPFKEFHVADDNRVKIAILSGDVDSPFVRIKDREMMIKAIFDYIGIDAKKENKFFHDVIQYRDDLTSFAWLRYAQILHETDFTDWLIAKKDYEFFLLKSNEDQANETDLQYYKKRNETRERIKELGKEVREIESKLFPDSKAAREAALADSRRRVKLYAESYAEPYSFK
jgi:hypothetical protein